MSLMLNTGALQYREDSSSSWQPLVLAANVDLVSLASAFSTSDTYEVGEYVRRDSRVYRCVTAITTAGQWDSTKWTEVNIGDELYNLNSALNTAVLQATRVDVSAAGTTTHTLTGLTDAHVVASWGMFTDSTMATAIPENAPTCDITITTGTDSWTLLIENYSAAFSIRPTFVLKQN